MAREGLLGSRQRDEEVKRLLEQGKMAEAQRLILDALDEAKEFAARAASAGAVVGGPNTEDRSLLGHLEGAHLRLVEEPDSAIGWTYCTDGLPPLGLEVEVARVASPSEGEPRLRVTTGNKDPIEGGAWKQGGDIEYDLSGVYAWRPLPEPPPVREETR